MAFYQQLQSPGQPPGMAQGQTALAEQADLAQHAQMAGQQDLAFQQQLATRRQALQARGQALQQERAQAQQQLGNLRAQGAERVRVAREAANAELARLGLGQYGAGAVSQVQQPTGGAPKPPTPNMPAQVQAHAQGGVQMPARPPGVGQDWRYNVMTGEWEPPLAAIPEVFGTSTLPQGVQYTRPPAVGVPIQTPIPAAYLPQALPVPAGGETGGETAGRATTAPSPLPSIPPSTPGQAAWQSYLSQHPETFYASYVEPAPTDIRWNGGGWSAPPPVPSVTPARSESEPGAREAREGDVREAARGFAHGGEVGALPPVPNALTGEGEITDGDYRVEIVVMPDATGIYKTEGPTLSALPEGARIIRVDEPNQALARELPPLPGVKTQAKGKTNGKVQRKAKGGTVGGALPPLTVSPGAPREMANPALGRRLPPIGNWNDISALVPSEMTAWDQYLRASGQAGGLEDIATRFRRSAPAAWRGGVFA